ncbi:MAG: hypothetical protein R6U92_05695 [Bacillota bacterium]
MEDVLRGDTSILQVLPKNIIGEVPGEGNRAHGSEYRPKESGDPDDPGPRKSRN